MTITTPPDGRLDGPVHEYFELTYANYEVTARTLAQSMPVEWQQRWVACQRELREAFEHIEHAPGYDVTAGSWMPANECSADELKLAGAEVYWVDADGETVQEVNGLPPGAEERYAWRNDEVDGHARIFVPGGEPVPHYNRGRTYVEPRIEADPDPEPRFVVRGKDKLAAATVAGYYRQCVAIGLDEQAEQVRLALGEVEGWQQRHPDLVKLPDHQHVPTARAEQTGASS